MPVLNQRFVRPRKHIDESRRDGEPMRIDRILRVRVLKIANSSYLVAKNRNIGDTAFGAGSIVDGAAFDKKVGLL